MATAASTPFEVAACLRELIELSQQEGIIVAGEVHANIDGMTPSGHAMSMSSGEDIHIYVSDDEDNPLVISVGRMKRGQR